MKYPSSKRVNPTLREILRKISERRGYFFRIAHASLSSSFAVDQHEEKKRERERGEVSSRLTNLVFPVRTKDQPLDKSVFIRNEGRPSSIYQRCPVHYSLSFLRGCIPIHQRPPFVLSLRPLWSTSLARRNSNFAPRQLCNLAELSTHRLIRSNQSSIWNSSKESLCKEERRKQSTTRIIDSMIQSYFDRPILSKFGFRYIASSWNRIAID